MILPGAGRSKRRRAQGVPIGTPRLSIQPIWLSTRMKMNSAIDRPTRSPSARTVFRVCPLSRIMKKSADMRLAMMPTKAMTMMILIGASIAWAPGR